ncbi:CBS domain-containing protein [bacterium]|nr:CBS domain-containing protein [bacterium]
MSEAELPATPASAASNAGSNSRLLDLAATVRRRVEQYLAQRDQSWVLILSILVGLIMGAVAAIFRYLIILSHHFFHESLLFSSEGHETTSPATTVLRALLPAFGGLVVGFFIYRVLKLQGGHGVPSVMKAVATGNTTLSPSMTIKSSSSIVTMTSGGSAGPEGPIIEIGSVVGSLVGQAGRVARDRVATLIGCGAASGIAAVFNAPIGGVFLALELIMRDFAIRTFAPVVIAAVTASVTTQALLPNHPVLLPVPASVMAQIQPSFPQSFAFAILGILCGLIGAFFVRFLYRTHDFFSTLRLPMWSKPAIGGLVVGLVGVFFPGVIGEGYMFVNTDILGPAAGGEQIDWTIQLAFLFLVAGAIKIFVTSMTLGSGGTGGSFAPAMVLGASLGAGFGVLCQLAFPGSMPHPAIFALVGMAGCVASSLGLPIAGILIIYEVTGAPYRLVLPLMLCVAASSLVATALRTGSVYTLSLLRDGFDVDEAVRRREDPLTHIHVGDIMRRDVTTLRPDDNIARVLSALTATLEDDFAVVTSTGDLVGIISTRDLRGVITMGDLGSAIIAADAADTNPKVLYPDSLATEALAIFSSSDVSGIPIVASRTSRKLVGILGRYDVLKAYRSSAGE